MAPWVKTGQGGPAEPPERGTSQAPCVSGAPSQEACSDLWGERRCPPGSGRAFRTRSSSPSTNLHQQLPLAGWGVGGLMVQRREQVPAWESLVTEALTSEGSPGPGSLRPGRVRVGPTRNTWPSQISGVASAGHPVPTLSPAPGAGNFALRYVTRGAEGAAVLAPRKLTVRGGHSHVDKPDPTGSGAGGEGPRLRGWGAGLAFGGNWEVGAEGPEELMRGKGGAVLQRPLLFGKQFLCHQDGRPPGLLDPKTQPPIAQAPGPQPPPPAPARWAGGKPAR